MNIKESYNKFLPLADKVAKIHLKYLSKDLKEDILSTAQLSVFEFCNLVLPTIENSLSEKELEDMCSEFVYKKVHKVYQTERKYYYEKSLNEKFTHQTTGEDFGQLQDSLETTLPSAQRILEIKNARTEIKKIFARLPKEDILIFNSMLKDTNLQESKIAKIYNKSEKRITDVVNKVLKIIFDNAGEDEYQKYYKKYLKTKKYRLAQTIKKHLPLLSEKEKKLLKCKYVLKMKEVDASREAGFNGPSNTQRILAKLRLLSGGDEQTKERLIQYIKKKQKLEAFIKFVKNDRDCQLFLSTINPKRRDIFVRHYFNDEPAESIAKSYGCFHTTITENCHTILKNLRKFSSSTDSEKQDILESIKRTQTNHKKECISSPVKKVVKEFMTLPDFQEIFEKFPKKDQYIINDYLIEGKTALDVSKKIHMSKIGTSRRGQILCKKIEAIVHGTEVEKLRAIQMLNVNDWFDHEIREDIKVFMEQPNFQEMLQKFPKVDQIIIKDYFINGFRSIDIAKQIGMGKSGINFRANKILNQIKFLNSCTPEEKAACLKKIEKQQTWNKTASKIKSKTEDKVGRD